MEAFKTTVSPQGLLEGRAAISRLWYDGTRVSESLSGSPNVATAPAFPRACGQVRGDKRVEGLSVGGSVGTREGS